MKNFDIDVRVPQHIVESVALATAFIPHAILKGIYLHSMGYDVTWKLEAPDIPTDTLWVAVHFDARVLEDIPVLSAMIEFSKQGWEKEIAFKRQVLASPYHGFGIEDLFNEVAMRFGYTAERRFVEEQDDAVYYQVTFYDQGGKEVDDLPEDLETLMDADRKALIVWLIADDENPTIGAAE